MAPLLFYMKMRGKGSFVIQSSKRRSEIARQAVLVRWNKRK